MPVRYVAEMFVDRMSASKNYNKEKYTDSSPLAYYRRGRDHYLIHEDTRALLELLLVMLAEKGEDATNRFIRCRLLRGKVPYEKEKLDRMRRKLEMRSQKL